MKIKYIGDLELFVRLTELKSLTAAANSLDISVAVASASLKRLEAELGVLLFVRTTRHIRLTKDGERFLAYCRPVVSSLREAEQEMTSSQSVSGVLQISMPSDLGRHVLMRWMDEFQDRYPSVSVRLQLTDRIADIVRQPVDLALRYGVPPDSSMVAIPLAQSNRRVLCASPKYVKQHGQLENPSELTDRNCLVYMRGEDLHDRWRFTRGTEEIDVRVKGNRVADDSDAVRRWAIDGYGICYRSYLDVSADIAEGRLVRLCENWDGEAAPLYLLSPARKQISATSRVLREYLQSKFNNMSASR